MCVERWRGVNCAIFLSARTYGSGRDSSTKGSGHYAVPGVMGQRVPRGDILAGVECLWVFLTSQEGFLGTHLARF